jgi:hypothetical protein
MNNKIEPHYVDFNTAKWLKEKGFNVHCNQRFWVGFENEEHFQDDCISNNWNDYDDSSTVYYSAPEQHVVVEWLRVNHGIEIEITKDRTVKWSNNYYNHVIFKNDVLVHQKQLGGTQPNTPQSAYSSAFDYIRDNNLI